MSFIQEGSTILFQGDSITDVGRNRDDIMNLGMGYPMMVHSWLAAMHPEKKVRIINKGIGGDKTGMLLGRWQEDALDLKPDVISILIGINDTWRRYDSNDPTSVETFESNYRKILEMTRNETDALVVLMEPFVLPVPEDRNTWREDLDPKIQVVRKLAREFGTLFVPLDGIFAAASMLRDPGFWAPDGVHPSNPGHALIARSWLQTMKVL